MVNQITDDSPKLELAIEIPKGTRNKYEYGHHRDVMFLERRLFSATFYPADYGFIPGRLAEDGDPLDVLGVFWTSDEHGRAAKITAVPISDFRGRSVSDIHDLDRHLKDEIRHFVAVYNDLEPGKHSGVRLR